MNRSLWREPLVHFLLFGAALFALHALWSVWTDRSERQLIVPTAEINRQASLYTIENGRPPSEAELNGIILAFVEEAVLAREAERLGLDVDDTVIRRRLAQKMRLVADATPIAPPSDETLRSWFDDRADHYVTPEQRTVQHVYFSDDGRDDPRADALSSDLSDWERVGDPFIIARQVGPISQTKLQQDYGEAFSRAAFETEINEWSAPVRSPYGVHRVRAIERIPAAVPDFKAQKSAALTDWMDAARREASAKRLRDMIENYDVVVEE